MAIAECQSGPRAGAGSMEERLERGEVEYFPACPFPMPEGEALAFLLEQRLASRAHKNISYHPHTGKAGGFLRHSATQAEKLRETLANFSTTATAWLARTLPRYAAGWRLDQVSFRKACLAPSLIDDAAIPLFA